MRHQTSCAIGGDLDLARLALLALAALLAIPAIPRPARAFSQEQVDKGRETYRLQCARCHGPDGQGVRNAYRDLTAPPLIGPGALPLDPHPYQKLRHFQFHTMLDVYEFASSVMPLDQPGSLYPQDYWNVMAYLLDANGEKPDGREMNQQTAAQISLDSVRRREASYAEATHMMGNNGAAAIMGDNTNNPGTANQSNVGAGKNEP